MWPKDKTSNSAYKISHITIWYSVLKTINVMHLLLLNSVYTLTYIHVNVHAPASVARYMCNSLEELNKSKRAQWCKMGENFTQKTFPLYFTSATQLLWINCLTGNVCILHSLWTKGRPKHSFENPWFKVNSLFLENPKLTF